MTDPHAAATPGIHRSWGTVLRRFAALAAVEAAVVTTLVVAARWALPLLSARA